jgi:hypothetical protein
MAEKFGKMKYKNYIFTVVKTPDTAQWKYDISKETVS